MAKKRKIYRPVGGFITEKPSPRITPKSRFLLDLEAKQKTPDIPNNLTVLRRGKA